MQQWKKQAHTSIATNYKITHKAVTGTGLGETAGNNEKLKSRGHQNT